jgi:hypothetical protein
MDAKTVLLLGIGMAVLLLLGYCVAPSRSASLIPGRHLRQELPRGSSVRLDLARRHATLAARLAEYRELHGQASATGDLRIFGAAEHNVAPLR